MASEALAVLKDRLQDFVHGAPGATRDLVAGFRSAHPTEISDASRELEDKALVSLVDQVCRRRAKAPAAGQGDLFHGPRHPEAIVVEKVVGGRRRLVRQPFDAATFEEAMNYLDRPVSPRKGKRDEGALATLDRLRPFFATPKTTVGEAKAAEAAALAAKAAQIQQRSH